MLDYDLEADRYDETRGGRPRAAAAAAAVSLLAPVGPLVDVACGTGSVTRELAARGRQVLGVDLSPGMARLAAARVPVVLGDSRSLPLADGSVAAASTIWLLHLLDDARPVIAECARVLRPGGVFVTTVDKNASAVDDIAPLLAPYRRAPSDGAELVTAEAARHGLRLTGETTFVGHGQRRTPSGVAADLRAGRYSFTPPGDLLAALTGLSEQDAPRPEPIYRVLAFS